jgi:hypothetical protein
VSSTSHSLFSVSVKIKHISQEQAWWLTTIYGPSVEDQKAAFLNELNDLRQIRISAWLLCGDFNMIYMAEDKNNSRLDRRRMGQFRRFLNEAFLKEIHLQGRMFTWSNECSHPTLERIDQAFISTDWECMFPTNDMYPLASLCSDHVPLLLQMDASFHRKKRFQFKSFWPRCVGFLEVVQRAWRCPLRDANPFLA